MGNSSLTVGLLLLGSVAALILIGMFWYRAPRWLAERENFTEPEISDSEARNRQILGQIFGAPAILLGVGTAVLTLVSGYQAYQESARTGRRQDLIQESQQRLNFNQLLKTGIDALVSAEPSARSAGAASLRALADTSGIGPIGAEVILGALQADVSKRIGAAGGKARCYLDLDTSGSILSEGLVTPVIQASLEALLVRQVDPDFPADLRDGCLRGARLIEAKMNASTLSGANFAGAELYRAKMHNSYLVGTNFRGANLTAADLTQSGDFRRRLSLANFCVGRNFATVDLSSGRKPVSTRLGGAALQSSCGDQIAFDGAFLDNADFGGVQYRFASFDDARLLRATFVASSLADVTFQRADLREALFVPSGTPPAYDDSRRTQLWNVNFGRSNLARAKFDRALLFEAVFDGADLTDVSFANSQIVGGQFQGAILLRTDFSESSLSVGLLEEALQCQTRMPDGVMSNRDCRKLPRSVAPPRAAEEVVCSTPGPASFAENNLDKSCRLNDQLKNCLVRHFARGRAPTVSDPEARCPL